MNLQQLKTVEIDDQTIEVDDAWIRDTTLFVQDERGNEWQAEVHGYHAPTGDFWGESADLEFEQIPIENQTP